MSNINSLIFQEKVWGNIKKGDTLSYKQIAENIYLPDYTIMSYGVLPAIKTPNYVLFHVKTFGI